MVKPNCITAPPESCVSTILGLIGRPTSATLTSRVTFTWPVSVSTSTSAPAPPTIQHRVACGVNDANSPRRYVTHPGDDLRASGIGTLPHVDGAAIKRAAAIRRHVDARHRGRGRDRGLEADGNTVSAAYRAVATVERPAPVHAHREPVKHRLDGSIAHHGAG